MIWLNLWFLPRAFFTARGPWVAASTRHSLRPLLREGDASSINSGETHRENAKPRGRRIVPTTQCCWHVKFRTEAAFISIPPMPPTLHDDRAAEALCPLPMLPFAEGSSYFGFDQFKNPIW